MSARERGLKVRPVWANLSRTWWWQTEIDTTVLSKWCASSTNMTLTSAMSINWKLASFRKSRALSTRFLSMLSKIPLSRHSSTCARWRKSVLKFLQLLKLKLSKMESNKRWQTLANSTHFWNSWNASLYWSKRTRTVLQEWTLSCRVQLTNKRKARQKSRLWKNHRRLSSLSQS